MDGNDFTSASKGKADDLDVAQGDAEAVAEVHSQRDLLEQPARVALRQAPLHSRTRLVHTGCAGRQFCPYRVAHLLRAAGSQHEGHNRVLGLAAPRCRRTHVWDAVHLHPLRQVAAVHILHGDAQVMGRQEHLLRLQIHQLNHMYTRVQADPRSTCISTKLWHIPLVPVSLISSLWL